MKASLCFIVTVLLAAGFARPALAQPVTEPAPVAPKSAAATAAITRATAVQREAAITYNRVLLNSKQAEVTTLKAAERSALGGSNLPEATAIASLITTLEGEIAQLSGNGSPAIRLTVLANKPWQSAGAIPAGTYTVEASGQWKTAPTRPWCGPDGSDGSDARGKPGEFALLIRVNGNEGKAGSRCVVTIPEHASVAFQMDDPQLGDNVGQLAVVMTRHPDPTPLVPATVPAVPVAAK